MRTFSPAKDALSVVYPARAALDAEHGRVFLHRNQGVDVVELASGRSAGRVELGWDGELWPTGKRLLAFHLPDVSSVEVAMIDPLTAVRLATCAHTVKGPAGSQILRVDIFTAKSTSFVKWETAPPPQQHGGAAMTDAQISAFKQRFDAAYACGLYAVRLGSGGCRLEPATIADAGLDRCETRQMPSPRLMPDTVGDLALRVDAASRPDPVRGGVREETHTFVVRGPDGQDRWHAEVEHLVEYPPAP